jgi:DNA polymerase-3 subunit gamma/tau
MAAVRDPGAGDGGYQVVARRFRPTTFADLVGQDEVLLALRQALAQKAVPHAFLFAGSRGVGKTTSARILARCLNCDRGPTPEPCGTCAACRSILDGSNPDVLEIDAASNNSVDDVRRLRELVGLAAMQSRYRVLILDEAHMLSKGAFNALLKTLEEPPPRVVFVLATTELHKVPDTITSRCQVLRFRRVDEGDLRQRLRRIADAERVAIPDDVLAEIAASVRGGVRDAETALERVLPVARELGAKFDLAAYRSLVARVGIDAIVDVVAGLLAGDARAALHFARALAQQGGDEREALGEIVEVLRWLLLLAIDGPDSSLVPLTGALRARLQQLGGGVEPARLDAMIAAGVLGRERLRQLEDRAVVLDLALVRMAQAASLPTVAELLAGSDGRAAPTPPAAKPAAVASPGSPPRPAVGDLRSRTLALLRDRQLLHGTVELCRFDGPDAQGVVTIALQSERRMHRDRLASPAVQADVLKAVQEAAGAPVRIEWRLPDLEASGPAPAASPRPPAAPAGPTTQRVLGAFGGRVVQVNPEDRAPRREPPGGEGPAAGSGPAADEPPPDLQE